MSAVSGFWKNKFEDTFVENNVLEKCVFDVDAENVVFGDDLEFVLPHDVYARQQQQLPNCRLFFKPFLHVNV
jgi:hypothetical protein